MVYKVETITITDTSKGFTAANLALARSQYGRDVKKVTCTNAVAQIRMWEDGTDPTATVGHIVGIGSVFSVDGENSANFRAIRTSAVSGVLSVAYEV